MIKTGHYIKNAICAIFMILLQHKVMAQTSFRTSYLENIPKKDVQCLYQDSKGFMWIGTLDGLHRFDGYEYKTYRVGDGPNSVSSNLIIEINEDSKGNLWIATYNKGLCRFNPVTEEFKQYLNTPQNPDLFNGNEITCLYIDYEDNIWTGNRLGYHRIKLNDDGSIRSVELFKAMQNPASKSDDDVKDIYRHSDGSLWISTNANLIHIYNPDAPIDRWEKEIIKGQHSSLHAYKDGFICAHYSGVLYLIPSKKKGGRTIRKRLTHVNCGYVYSQDNRIWTGNRNGILCFEKEGDAWVNSAKFSYNLEEPTLRSNIITCIYGNGKTQVWVGSRSGGVDIISERNKNFEVYHQTKDAHSLSSNLCRTIFEDHNQNLWIGTEDGGLNYLPASSHPNYKTGFQHIAVNRTPNENRVYATEEVLLPHSKKHESLIFIGSSYNDFLSVLDPKTFEIQYPGNGQLNIGNVFALESVGDTVLWVGTYGQGLLKLSLNEDGEILRHKAFTPEKGNPKSISSHIIRNLHFDSKGYLWISTDKGLNRLSPKELNSDSPRFEVFTKDMGKNSITHDYILQVFEASDGTIWIGTMGGGLLRYFEHGGSGFFENFTTKHGLPNDAVKSIVEDEEGNLWLGSNNGLSKFNPATNVFTNYDETHGLQDKEFSEICAIRRKNGQIIYGGLKGFNVFYPDEILKDTVKPKMFLTDFYIHNSVIKPGEKFNNKVILDKAVQYTKEVKLQYAANSFSIGFVALHYEAPQKNKYEYMLEGFDEKWHSSTAKYRIAKYTNIPPGRYTFKVIGSNSDNVPADKPAELSIRVLPPIYLSGIAILIYLLLLVALTIIARRNILARVQRRKELLVAQIERKQTEEMAQMKLKFFTNISHEFRTPLTLINAPLTTLVNNNNNYSASQRLNTLHLIQQNVNVMMRLINQLLDFRKMEQGKMKLRCNQHDMVHFVEFIYNSFAPMAIQKNINFKINVPKDTIMVWFDAEKIEKVLYNLLSNAFKFTPSEGVVEMGIKIEADQSTLLIYIKDSGTGIEPEDQAHLFERYYQKQNKRSGGGGTGIGLSLSKDLVEMHKGNISFNSKVGEGSVFSMRLLLGDTHLQDSDKDILQEANVESSFGGFKNDLPANVFKMKEHKKSEKFKKTILVVEDNNELRFFLQQRFSDSFNVLLADNGQDGLNVCNTQYPDLVVSDIMMPIMDGYELCKQIKQNEAISHIPVLLLTAKNNADSQILGFELGADSYLGKPFNPDVLHARMQALINNRALLHKKFQREMEISPSTVAKTSADTKFMEKIISIVEKNVAESDFSVEQLASEYGVSRIYLNRKIKALTGETSIQFIRNIRLKLAANLMSKGEYNINEITWMVGYNDLRTFRIRFREKFGMSPSEYMKSVRGK